jgi:hypothetical protein
MPVKSMTLSNGIIYSAHSETDYDKRNALRKHLTDVAADAADLSNVAAGTVNPEPLLARGNDAAPLPRLLIRL